MLVTVKLDGVDLDTATLLLLFLVLGIDNLDLLGTTTLRVADSGSLAGAVAAVLALAAIRHIVVEL